jgi:hypothetical protein
MHDLQTIVRLNNQPVNQRTPAAVRKEQQIRAEASYNIAADRVVFGSVDLPNAEVL